MFSKLCSDSHSGITGALEIAKSGANLVSYITVLLSRNLGCALADFYGHYSPRDLHMTLYTSPVHTDARITVHHVHPIIADQDAQLDAALRGLFYDYLSAHLINYDRRIAALRQTNSRINTGFKAAPRRRPRGSACAPQHRHRHQQASTGMHLHHHPAITAPAANPGPLGPVQTPASRLQVYA